MRRIIFYSRLLSIIDFIIRNCKFTKLVIYLGVLIFIAIGYFFVGENTKNDNTLILINDTNGIKLKDLSQDGEDYLCLIFPYRSFIKTNLFNPARIELSKMNNEFTYTFLFVSTNPIRTRRFDFNKYMRDNGEIITIRFLSLIEDNCTPISDSAILVSIKKGSSIYFELNN